MKAFGRQVLAAISLLAVGGFVVGCGDEAEKKGNHEIWFMGSIYDGATGEVIPDYQISLTFGKTTVTGTVDGNGRYTLGPLTAWNDYAVTIYRDYYRAFVSYNAGIVPPTPPPASQQSDVYTANTTQTFNFDAYLFPQSLQAAPLTVNILKSDATAAPAEGSVRLRPTTLPSIQDQTAGVAGQVWSNDQDILADAYNAQFAGGMITVPAEELVYGVSYQVTVYNVAGYQPNTATVRAGAQENVIVTIATTASPLLILSNTLTQCRPFGQSTNVVATAQVSFTFNTSAVEDVTSVTAGRGQEVLDNGLQVMTALGATLKSNVSTAVQERGTSFILNGSTLSFSWNPSVGLNTPSASDTINYVIYGGLSSIQLQPTGHPELVKSMSTLLNGVSSVTCGS